VCDEFPDVFAESVNSEQAKVTTMDLDVDIVKWREIGGKKRFPRPQNTVRQIEIQRQVDELLKLNIIRASKADRYSLVLLAPKPGDKWRLCVDYR
jgi:hypothetical protein